MVSPRPAMAGRTILPTMKITRSLEKLKLIHASTTPLSERLIKLHGLFSLFSSLVVLPASSVRARPRSRSTALNCGRCSYVFGNKCCSPTIACSASPSTCPAEMFWIQKSTIDLNSIMNSSGKDFFRFPKSTTFLHGLDVFLVRKGLKLVKYRF